MHQIVNDLYLLPKPHNGPLSVHANLSGLKYTKAFIAHCFMAHYLLHPKALNSFPSSSSPCKDPALQGVRLLQP